jgi:uncharacterized protein involved in exopolysaccharide biosynthesis
VLQTLGSNEPYRSSEPASGEEFGQGAQFSHYIEIIKRRFFYFLLPFAVVSTAGLYIAATQKPDYLSEGKILIESPVIAPDAMRAVITTSTANERIQLIQQRIMTRDTLLSIADKFGLFPGRTGVLDLMTKSTQIKPVEFDGQRTPTIAFTVSFEYDNPELAMRVASELVTLIVGEDARSRNSRATEAVKILTGETKDIEDKLESTQMEIFEVARRPRETVPDTPEQEKSQLTALAALRAELIQKMSIYSDAHPAVIALKKRIAAMEKTVTQSTQTPAKTASTQTDDLEALKRQREALEKQLADANSRLATARLNEKLDRGQQSERLQVLEAPPLPQKPLKSNRLKLVGIAFALAAMLGAGTVLVAELLNGSIRGRHQLAGVVANSLIIPIPYITTRGDVVRARLRTLLAVISVGLLLAAVGGLVTAIILNLHVDLTLIGRVLTNFREIAAGR